jgi:hypothetical protein
MLTAIASLHLAGSTLLCALLALPGELKLKETDHKTLSKGISAYFTARIEEKGIIEALQDALEQIQTTEKKLKGTKLLAAVSDWEQVFRLVTQDRLQETLKKKGDVAADKRKVGSIEINFAYCTPKKAPKGALPLVLIACDDGEAPSAHLNTHWNDPTLREGALLVAIDLGKDTQSWGLFGSPAAPGGAFLMMTALSLIQKEFPVDCNRRFLAGSGKGFAAVEGTATSYPYVFAGVIGIGDVSVADPANLENFRTLPTLLLKGGEGAKAIEAKVGELGYANCRVEAEGGVAQALEWMGKNPRNSYPAQVTFAPKIDNALTVHWLSLLGLQSAEKPRIEAKADRASNTITIDAQKIAEVVIYLNDELVDLDKPVRFVINGTTHERTVERNPTEMIKNQYNIGDWGRVFSAFVALGVPEK